MYLTVAALIHAKTEGNSVVDVILTGSIKPITFDTVHKFMRTNLLKLQKRYEPITLKI